MLTYFLSYGQKVSEEYYFKKDSIPEMLDPGSELLSQCVVITNNSKSSRIEFSLSLSNDRQNSISFVLNAGFSGMYKLQGKKSCWIHFLAHSKESSVELNIAKCYSLKWADKYTITIKSMDCQRRTKP